MPLARRTRLLGATTLTALLVAAASTSPALARTSGPSASEITVRWDTTTAVLNTTVTLHGAVTDQIPTARPVALQQHLPTGWRTVSSARTDTAGRFTLRVPTGWLYRTPIRVTTPAVGSSAADATYPHDFTVTPGYTPLGKASNWARLVPKHNIRFNPCAPITYRVNTAEAPAAALSDVRTALQHVTEASGLRFRYLGTTTAIPGSGRKWPGTTMLVIAWAKPDQTKWALGGTVAARGGVIAGIWGKDADSKVEMTTRAGIVVDATLNYYTPDQQTHLLMHELGHAAGLGHVPDALISQYMNPGPSIYNLVLGQWGAGDLAGLRQVGLAQGCVTPILS